MNTDSVICYTTVVVNKSLQNDWMFQEFLIDGHCVSVALNSKNESDICTPIAWTDVSLMHLLEFQESLDNLENMYWKLFCDKTKIKPF